jgi:hypothetical protein
MNDFYKFFGLSNVPKDFKDKQEVNNIYKTPKKDKRLEVPRFYNFETNNTHQMDILYMPEDTGYKYVLVIVDVGSRYVDAEPLKKIDSKEVVKAMNKIYKRKVLSKPERIIVDSGSEFKSDFERELEAQEIALKKALPGRKRQVGIVEKYNGILAKVLFMRMASEELVTGEPSTEWVDDLPMVIRAMNNKYGRTPKTEKELLKELNPMKDLKEDIIPLNTVVRVKLDEPKGITGERLHGRFRATDHRWSLEKYKVVDYIFDPIQPVLYKLDKKVGKNEGVAYTRNQLQVVQDDEEDPPYKDVVKSKKERELYIIRDIIGHRKYKGKDQYLIWWKGFKKDESTWEYSNNILKEKINKFKEKDS